MDWLNQIWTQIATYISIPYLLTFIFLSFMIKRYFGEWLQMISRFEWKTVYTVLILATLIAVPFLVWSEVSWVQIVFSYSIGTSLHELIFTHIDKLFKINKI